MSAAALDQSHIEGPSNSPAKIYTALNTSFSQVLVSQGDQRRSNRRVIVPLCPDHHIDNRLGEQTWHGSTPDMLDENTRRRQAR